MNFKSLSWEIFHDTMIEYLYIYIDYICMQIVLHVLVSGCQNTQVAVLPSEHTDSPVAITSQVVFISPPCEPTDLLHLCSKIISLPQQFTAQHPSQKNVCLRNRFVSVFSVDTSTPDSILTTTQDSRCLHISPPPPLQATKNKTKQKNLIPSLILKHW